DPLDRPQSADQTGPNRERLTCALASNLCRYRRFPPGSSLAPDRNRTLAPGCTEDREYRRDRSRRPRGQAPIGLPCVAPPGSAEQIRHSLPAQKETAQPARRRRRESTNGENDVAMHSQKRREPQIWTVSLKPGGRQLVVAGLDKTILPQKTNKYLGRGQQKLG